MEGDVGIPRSGNIQLIPASVAHVGRLAHRLREIDRREVAALGTPPKHALRLAVVGSVFSLTAMLDGTPHAMFGVSPISPWLGRPWFLGSEEVYRHGREMLTFGRDAIAEMLRSFSKLENWVSCENGRAIRLLQRWGFDVHPEMVEIGGLTFHRFTMER